MRFSDSTISKVRWQERALCREGVRPDVFFPETKPEPRAKQLCAECPVQAACLAYALANDAVGIWGGTSTKERRKMGRPMPRFSPIQLESRAG